MRIPCGSPVSYDPEYRRSWPPTAFFGDLLTDVVGPAGVCVAANKEDVLELTDRGVLSEALDAKGDMMRLLALKPSVPGSNQPTGLVASPLDGEPTRILVPILLRSWIMQCFYSDASYHLGVLRTSRMPERLYW